MDSYIHIFTIIIICGLLGKWEVVGQTCKQIGVGKNNVNKRLIGFKIAEKVVPGLHDCARECMYLAHCKSFNFGQDDNLCEVNHADSHSASVGSLQTVQRYIFSDISAWPRTMVGPCADQTCTGTQRCVPEKGCIDTDCDDPPEIDYAVVHPGAVTLSATRTYEFDCPPVMMKNGTNEVTCGLDFKWSPLYTRCRVLQNCSDVKMCNPTYSDGEYWIYPEAMGGHKIKVFCYGMTTTSPSEYITGETSYDLSPLFDSYI
ncbi:uncharacterized protein LOC123541874 [Mercenaria mercenaria]|uniref:uncharacterized protein LOC123541874 n=1 Tax=Mercenaria mercenaria TaxID=6596 RepID=UPI00234E5F03|nr:uncharacterized protein LOC123541874 [Mercenaria mercenaria]